MPTRLAPTHKTSCESHSAARSPRGQKPAPAAPSASLLIAALALLRHPCRRSRATARLLLERAADYGDLSPAEREVCRSLADDIDVERTDINAMSAAGCRRFSPCRAALKPLSNTPPAKN